MGTRELISGATLKTALGETIVEPVLLFENTPIGSFELLTIKEAAKLLKISVSGMRRLQQGRQLPFFKVRGGLRFLRADIMSYLVQHRIGPIGQ